MTLRPTRIVVAALCLLAGGLGGCSREPAPRPAQGAELRQPFRFGDYVPQPVGGPVDARPWVAQVDPLDLDRDGLMDLIVCEAQRNEVIWLRQARRGVFEEHVLAAGIAGVVRAEPCDIDRDGDTDLLTASMGVVFPNNEKIGSVVILENDGRQRFTPRRIIENIARVTDVRAGDFNGDGLLDLAVAQFGYVQGEVRWMENLGDWKFKSRLLLNLSGAIHTLVADFDGNGTADIAALVSQQWEEVHLFRNGGQGVFTHHVVYGSTNEDYGSSGITHCDLNKDGRPDILFSNGDGFDYAQPGPRPWHGVQWLENTGGGKFKYHRIGDLPGAYCPVAVDLDGDGALDVVAVSGFNTWDQPGAVSLMAFQNDGRLNFTARPLAHTPTHLLAVAVADLDGNGKPVLVTGAFHAYPPFEKLSRLTLWRQRGAGEAGGAQPAGTSAAAGSNDATAGRTAERSSDEPSRMSAALQERLSAAELRVRDNPGKPAPLGDLARLQHANGLTAEAEKNYRRLLDLDGGNPRWAHLLANLVAGYGRLEEAVPLWRRVTELDPSYGPARLRLGDALLKSGRLDEADAAYQQLLAREPRNVYALLGLARIDLARERYTAAREKLTRASAIDPAFFGAQSLLASVFERLGDDEAARAAKARASQAGRFREAPDPWFDALIDECFDVYRLQVAAATAKSTGATAAAVPLLQRALTLDPNDPRTLRQLGSTHVALKELDRAKEPLEKAVVLAPQDAESWLELAAYQMLAGQLAAAEQTLTEGLSKAGDTSAVHAELGALRLKLRRHSEAIPHLEEAVRVSPEKPEVMRDYVTALFEAGRTEDGAKAIRDAIARHPEFPPLLLQAARFEITQQNADAAAQLLRRAEKAGASPGELIRLGTEFRRQFNRDP